MKKLTLTKLVHLLQQNDEAAFEELGIAIRWEGEGVNEKGYHAETGQLLVDVNPEFYRPAEVEFLWGNPAKAEKDAYGLSPKLVGPNGSICQNFCLAATRLSTKSYALFPKLPIP